MTKKLFNLSKAVPSGVVLDRRNSTPQPRVRKNPAARCKIFNDMITEAVFSTTNQERMEISEAFSAGRPMTVAMLESGGINPMALLVASLVDAENPLVIDDGRLLYTSLLDCARFLLARISETVDNPVDNPVDKLLITCGEPVDKSATYPQVKVKKTAKTSYPQFYQHPVGSYPQVPVDNLAVPVR